MKSKHLILGGLVAALTFGGSFAVGAAAAGASTALSPVSSCVQAAPGYTGTWQDTSNGQYLGAVGNPQRPDSSATVKGGPQSGTETTNCFKMTHPAAYSADNGALVQWINGGRSQFGKYLACSLNGTSLTFVNTPSAANGPTDFIYDGNGFTCMGNYLVLSKTGGVIGSAHMSPFASNESPTQFVDASLF